MADAETHGKQPVDPAMIARNLRPAIIAIDGPAASGKSTIGYLVAIALDYLFFDTGAMYRAVTWVALHHGVNPAESDRVVELAQTTTIDVAAPDANSPLDRKYSVYVNGRDITDELRLPEVDRWVSAVSAIAGVRENLGGQQRRIALDYGSGRRSQSGVVMVGRDIGTVIVPDAPLKIFLDASLEVRARRRLADRQGAGHEAELQAVMHDLRRRDALDSAREVAPLRAAEDAVHIDTSDLTPEQVVEVILQEAARVIRTSQTGVQSTVQGSGRTA